MRARHNPLDRLLNADYHESFDLYTPRRMDFHDLVIDKLPDGWEIIRRGMWFCCSRPKSVLPDQGWKIHISSSRDRARELLDRVTSVLFAAGTADFKFVLDIPTLLLLNGKTWSRGGSGKFITIYPKDSREFLELIESLRLETYEFQGPYILSDYQYKDSQVVFYRYGGIRARDVLDVTGGKVPILKGPDGAEIPDRRLAYPVTPAWAESALPPAVSSETSCDSHSLCEGRYQIEGVIDFSSAGGIYRGRDRFTGAHVVLKEARPCIETPGGRDAVTLLKKEYWLLNLVADTGAAPKPVDLFQEGTHWFLVEEHISGSSLSEYSASHNVLLRTRPSDDDFRVWYSMFRKLALRLIEIVLLLHDRGVVFSDLSPSNIIVIEGGNDLKLIDFEGAFQPGVDPPDGFYTPGFVSQRRLQGAVASREDDCYAVGAVLLALLLPINAVFHLKPMARQDFMAAIERDARIPKSAAEMVLGLMEADPVQRPNLALAAELLPQDCATPAPEAEPPLEEDVYEEAVAGVAEHILEAATCSRSDRLFPADPRLFATNPLSLAYGATGVAYALQRITGSVPQQILDWILAHAVTHEAYPPGLYVGMSGIAWALLETGHLIEAERVFELTFKHRLLEESVDLFYGLAGWGLSNLRFFLATGNELYLQNARTCGNKLLIRNAGSSQARWARQPDQPLGLAHGASGVALYLLNLYLITREERFLSAGQEILQSDLDAGIETRDGGLTWNASAGSPAVVYPYWRTGSAGVGSAVVRYHRVTGDDRYLDVVEKIFIDTDRKYGILPGRFAGLAGLGDFLLDAWSLTGKKHYLESAHKVAHGIMKFRVDRKGIAFPGETLSRLCCDYGTGSAGIALFLNRLLGKQGSDFLLDSLLSLGQTQPLQCVPPAPESVALRARA